jgi:hypothetical protein
MAMSIISAPSLRPVVSVSRKTTAGSFSIWMAQSRAALRGSVLMTMLQIRVQAASHTPAVYSRSGRKRNMEGEIPVTC